jgi:hypothetical protein
MPERDRIRRLLADLDRATRESRELARQARTALRKDRASGQVVPGPKPKPESPRSRKKR